MQYLVLTVYPLIWWSLVGTCMLRCTNNHWRFVCHGASSGADALWTFLDCMNQRQQDEGEHASRREPVPASCQQHTQAGERP